MIGGTAWYGFRELTAANYFSTAAALSLTSVEIPLYWQIVEDTRFNLHKPEELIAVAKEAGVQMYAGVAAIELATPFDIRGLPITQSSVDFNKALAKQVIDVGSVLGLQLDADTTSPVRSGSSLRNGT